MAGITLLLITAAMCFVLVILSNLAQAQTDESHSFEIIFLTNQNTELTGSITLQCRDVATAETLEIDDVKFWLNRTSACDLDLITRADVQVIIVDNNGMKFNLSRNLEGNYTCGRLSIQESGIIVKESTPKTMICKFCNLLLAWYYIIVVT